MLCLIKLFSRHALRQHMVDAAAVAAAGLTKKALQAMPVAQVEGLCNNLVLKPAQQTSSLSQSELQPHRSLAPGRGCSKSMMMIHTIRGAVIYDCHLQLAQPMVTINLLVKSKLTLNVP